MIRLALALALVLGLSVVTSAYVYNGHRWPGTTQPYLVNVDSCVGPGLVPAAFLNDVTAAAFAWTEQTNANFQFTYSGTTTLTGLNPDGVMTVFCTSDPDDSGLVGSVYWWYGGDGNLFDADVWLHLGNYPFVTSDQPCAAAVFVLDILVHEFGHALSLGHSADLNASMWTPATPCATKDRTLYSDDIAAIESVYGLRVPPDPVPVPVVTCLTDGLTYPLGARLTFSGNTGQAAQWLTARQAEHWVLLSRSKTKGGTALVVQCGLTDAHAGQQL